MVQPTDVVRKRSVVEEPQYEEAPFGEFIMWLASIADDIMPWGGGAIQFLTRNKQLRQFWMQEPTLASALYTITIRDASFSWTIKGDQPLTVKATQEMLHNADLGKGWLDFIQKWRLDFLTVDNGAFFEVIRRSDSPNSSVIGINHLDSLLCRRTGVPDWPVIYTDRKGVDHKLRPWQIVATADFPSPIETANGVGVCAVSRVLRQAQFMRDISIRDRERSSGADPKTLHIITGVPKTDVENAIKQHREVQLDQGYVRYSKPVIFSNIDPSKPASVASLDLAPRPDQWDLNIVQTWYITLLAMALGVDYQDLAPLPSRGIGGSMQSMILHEKAKGKGPELFMKTIEHAFNFHGIMPRNVEFSYNEKDPAAEVQNAELLRTQAEAHKMYNEAGILSPQASRNMLLDGGIISQEIFDLASMGEPDATPEVLAESDEPNLQQPGGQSPNIITPEGEKENLANFDERERKRWEAEMFRDMEKALDSIFKDLKKAVLPKKLRGEKADPGEIIEGEKFWAGFRKTMTGAMAPNARQIFLGVAEFNQSLGLAVDMEAINIGVHEFTRTYTTQWLQALEGKTRDGLRQAVMTWQQGGLGAEGLPDLVSSIEPLFGKGRAQRIAQTETTRVFDLGNKASHISAGVEYEQWQTANDDLVRDEHQGFQGQVYAVDEGPRPSDFVNCRCARVPISTEIALTLLGGEEEVE